MSRSETVVNLALQLSERLSPVLGGPAAPLKTRALFASFGPSLMPRGALQQGVAAGLSVLAAELIGRGVDAAIRRVVPEEAPFALRIGARAGVAAAGVAVASIPESDDEPTAKASLRTAGRVTASGAIGGAIYEAGTQLTKSVPPKSALRPLAIGAAGLAAQLYYGKDLLTKRQDIIESWSADEKRATLGASLGIGFAVTTLGRGIGHGFMASRRSLVKFFGDDPAHAPFGRVVNGAIWVAGGTALYYALVAAIARNNEKIEPAYSVVPTSPYVSAGPNSISPFDELGSEGRRFVTDLVTPEMIESTLGEPAVAHPIRAFVGFNSEPLYSAGRSEMMLDELDRLGAFDRSYLLLVCPTGTGWVDQTMVEAAEIYARGDIATACIQYGRGPSFLEVQKVALGRIQFRGLLWGVKMRLEGMPVEKRPKVLVFGESLGSWASSDVVMHQGISGFDHYGIDRALWFGLVGFAKWSKTGMRQGSGDLVPTGTVLAFDNFGQYEPLTAEQRDRLRAVIVDHDNDPIAQMSLRWAVKRPPWLQGDTRGRGVASSMDWVPLVTFVQIMVDAMNAMVTIPGHFKSFGHDYRGDTIDFVHAAYRFADVTEEQKKAVTDTLLNLEVARGERINNEQVEIKAGDEKRTKGPAWYRGRTKLDDAEPAIEESLGIVSGDIQ